MAKSNGKKGQGSPIVSQTPAIQADAQQSNEQVSRADVVENITLATEYQAITQDEAAQLLWEFLETGPNGMEHHQSLKTLKAKLGTIGGYIEQGMPSEMSTPKAWNRLLGLEKTKKTFTKVSAGTGSIPKGHQQFSGHDNNDIAKAYVGEYGTEAQKACVPDKSTHSKASEEKAIADAKVAKQAKIKAARVAVVNGLMAEAFKTGKANGLTQQIIRTMNGYDKERADKARAAFKALREEFGEFEFMEFIPTGPEHEYTESELIAMPELAMAMAYLKANDKEYAKAFEQESK